MTDPSRSVSEKEQYSLIYGMALSNFENESSEEEKWVEDVDDRRNDSVQEQDKNKIDDDATNVGFKLLNLTQRY
jgi:hypothetical protein